MKVTHKISFQIGQAFEQHSAEFTLEEEDLVGHLGGLNVVEKMLILDAVALINGLLFQLTEGYMSKEAYKGQYERIISLMGPKLREVLNSVFKSGS